MSPRPITIILAALLLVACAERGPVSSRSYRGHEHDYDMQQFVRAYPNAAGTRLDDCVTCHREGTLPYVQDGQVVVSACDYCHYAKSRHEPWSVTLNPYGKAYERAGRTAASLNSIAGADSDGDRHSNRDEIRARCFPGYAASNPDNPKAPYRVLTMAELRAMPRHSQFMLLNFHKQRRDLYSTYAGVRIADLLEELEIDVDAFQGVTVFAPDGFAKTFTREQVLRKYPPTVFHANLDDAALGEGKGIVTYPPGETLADGEAVPGRQFLLLAFERDGHPIPAASIDPMTFKMIGNGPLRIVLPQTTPSAPDRGSRYPQGDAYDYDENLDHNAEDSVRGVTVIRVDPVPDGLEQFDAKNASWRFLEEGKLVIYGFGVG